MFEDFLLESEVVFCEDINMLRLVYECFLCVYQRGVGFVVSEVEEEYFVRMGCEVESCQKDKKSSEESGWEEVEMEEVVI